MLAEWLEALLALIFPPRCPACREWVETRGWCQACLDKTIKPKQLALAMHNLVWLDECLAVVEYQGKVQRLIRDMKFRRLDKYAVHLSQLLKYGVEPDRYRDIDAIVPVPLNSERLKERGFNQTSVIFQPWADSQGLVWLDALERIRPTVPQWELTLMDRRKNIKGAFKVTRPELVIGKNILLVDDIFTSGITMNECAYVLKQAGAIRVMGLAVATGAN